MKRWRGTLNDQLSRMIYERLYLGNDHVASGHRDRIHGEIRLSARVKNRHGRAALSAASAEKPEGGR